LRAARRALALRATLIGNAAAAARIGGRASATV
jgi:hypothetical protein